MKDNIMNDLAAYGIARDTARGMAADTEQEGTPVFGFNSTPTEYEISAGKPFDLAEYNIGFNIIAPDSTDFNLIVRKDNPDAIKSLPRDKLRNLLVRILDSV
jgi:hypothetical protein